MTQPTTNTDLSTTSNKGVSAVTKLFNPTKEPPSAQPWTEKEPEIDADEHFDSQCGDADIMAEEEVMDTHNEEWEDKTSRQRDYMDEEEEPQEDENYDLPDEGEEQYLEGTRTQGMNFTSKVF